MKKFVLAGALALATAGAANAGVYNVNYTVGSTVFEGTYTIAETANGNGLFLVTDLTGTFGGLTATLLAPLSFSRGGNFNNNLIRLPSTIYPNSSIGFDTRGLAFKAGGTNYNIYFANNGTTQCAATVGGQCTFNTISGVTNFSVVAQTAAVPEPATWAMLMLGFGAMGYALRRKAKISTRIRFA